MLRLTFSPSYYLAVLLAILHGLAIFSIILIDALIVIKVLLILLIFGSLIYYGRQALLLSKSSVVAAIIKDPDLIEIVTRAGKIANGNLVEGSYISVYFSSICYKREGTRLTKVIPVLPDTLSQEEFRELRVWLRWKKIGQIDIN